MVKSKVFIRILFLLVLSVSSFVAFPRTVDTENFTWSRVDIPSSGVSGQWVLAEGSDLHSLTMASDGTLYCCANPSSTPYRLFKSINGGAGWGYTGRVEDAIVDIAVSAADPNRVYYATISQVYKSIDAGENFTLLGSNPGGSGAGNRKITSLAAGFAAAKNYLAVGVCDTDAAQYGGVYWLDESQPGVWHDGGLGNYDVYKVAFSPRLAEDGQLIVIATNEQDTIISSGTLQGAWGLNTGAALLTGLIIVSADIAFPADYDSLMSTGGYTQFVSLNTGNGQGGVYRLQGRASPASSLITDLHIGGVTPIDIASLVVCGAAAEAKLLAGSASSSQIIFSEDAGITWASSSKPPSGDSGTQVVMAADFAESGLAYAITSGAESAFSISCDTGQIWNQTGLIDTRLSTILDLAVSPDYALDNTLFLLTANIQNSLWYSSDQGVSWERIYCTSPFQSERLNLILLSPQYSANAAVFLAGTDGGNPFIWKSENNGQSFTRQASVDLLTGSPVAIDAWTITSGNVIFVASFDGDHALVYQTGPDSLAYVDKGVAGRQILSSLAVSPNYAADHTLLAGNTFGRVFFSNDNGRVFESLPFNAAEPPFAGNVSVAFDVGFAQNQTVYAADDTAGKGVFRFVIGESYAWEAIAANLPAEGYLGQVAVSTSGVLYALNSQPVDNALNQGGIERSLDPAVQSPVFETVLRGLEDGITLKKLWLQGDHLWTVDTHHNQLLTWTDTLVAPVNLNSPADGAAGLNPDNTTLTWQSTEGADAYHWQLAAAADFLSIADEGETAASQITLTDLDKNIIYYCRVRAIEPVLSPWSPVRSFNTCHLDVPALSQPSSSGTASIAPIFRWSVCEGAVQYELKVALDDGFSSQVISRLCNANVWLSNISLQNRTTYYWKVRAIGDQITSNWSAVGLFTTESETASELNPPRPTSPLSSTSAAVEPVFRWSAVDGADQYQLAVAKNDLFSSLVIDQLCHANTWVCAVTLDYETAYYWKVRALQGALQSDWSDVGAFTTKSAPAAASGGAEPPAETTSPVPTPTPVPSPLLPFPSTAAAPIPSPSIQPTLTEPVSPSVILETSALATTSVVPSPSTTDSAASPTLISAPAEIPPESPASSNSPISSVIFWGVAGLAGIATGTTIFLIKKPK